MPYSRRFKRISVCRADASALFVAHKLMRSRYCGFLEHAGNGRRIICGTCRKSPMDGLPAMIAWQPERTANRLSNVIIERQPKVNVDGEKIAEGARRLKFFFAVFTTPEIHISITSFIKLQNHSN
jgi:hypothetical protein